MNFPVAGLSNDELITLRQIITDYRAEQAVIELMYPSANPTSKLLSTAATLIHDLMSGRGVDRRSSWQWEDFVRQLQERAAAFKACEDEGK